MTLIDLGNTIFLSFLQRIILLSSSFPWFYFNLKSSEGFAEFYYIIVLSLV